MSDYKKNYLCPCGYYSYSSMVMRVHIAKCFVGKQQFSKGGIETFFYDGKKDS